METHLGAKAALAIPKKISLLNKCDAINAGAEQGAMRGAVEKFQSVRRRLSYIPPSVSSSGRNRFHANPKWTLYLRFAPTTAYLQADDRPKTKKPIRACVSVHTRATGFRICWGDQRSHASSLLRSGRGAEKAHLTPAKCASYAAVIHTTQEKSLFR